MCAQHGSRGAAQFGDDPTSGRKVVAKDGRFGVYVTDGETNASIGKGDRIEEISPERAFELLAIRETGAVKEAPSEEVCCEEIDSKKDSRKEINCEESRTKSHMTQPVYIAFEGPEACGKSTQAQRLAESIGAVLTRETGGTDIGAQLRSILHNVDTVGLDDHAETLIVAADRAQHLAEVVRPALERGEHVVSDRSVYSSLAYQGYGQGLPVDDVRRINEWAIGSTWPDLVILLKTDDVTLQRRMNERDLDRIEQAGSDFHRRVREGFADMAAADPNRWYVVDASTPADETAATIRKVVSERLGI